MRCDSIYWYHSKKSSHKLEAPPFKVQHSDGWKRVNILKNSTNPPAQCNFFVGKNQLSLWILHTVMLCFDRGSRVGEIFLRGFLSSFGLDFELLCSWYTILSLSRLSPQCLELWSVYTQGHCDPAVCTGVIDRQDDGNYLAGPCACMRSEIPWLQIIWLNPL